ncbi:hypothetical protein MSKOL_0826 [Methanosarcina sp. Kolksee]|uniref:hypothetical protein n=1 Tax=Methanosarcina sp. Kolksee TaxID=1434099 RepID=UPI000615A517|nr:hypothetical protein [Methanosarcina sp. Kolksee]AKB46603.1 hypothetical protein MSKOL_0826 [Methanosarcina sp. Kolksee]
MSKIFRYAIITLLIFCIGCIENEQRAIVTNIENNNSTNEIEINLVEGYYKELDKAEEMASYINNIQLINYYNRPRMDYVFDEEVFYMNESELEKVEYERAMITLNRQPLHFVNLNKIEEFGTSDYNNTHINSIVYTAFTPMYNLDDEQTNCIMFSRNILLKHCSTEAEKNTLSEYFKTLDTWSKFKNSLVYANVPMNNSDENRTFVIDNVGDMDIIIGLEWKQADMEQYFEFLDKSGFDSSDNMLNFARQFRIAKQNINNESSSRKQEQIYEAREFVIANFPQNSNDIDKSDIQKYFKRCDART